MGWPALNHGYGFPSKTTLDLACLGNGTGLARQWQWDVNEIGLDDKAEAWNGIGMARGWQRGGNELARRTQEQHVCRR